MFMLRKTASTFVIVVLAFACACSSEDNTGTVFQVDVENISTLSSFANPDGSPMPIVLSAAVWAAAGEQSPIFTVGAPASSALQSFAEDGDPGPLADALTLTDGVALAGLANETVNHQSLLGPGEKYSFLIASPRGDRLSLAMAYLQANDLFVSTPDVGASLFDEAGNPRSGDITAEFALYDAGTEVNQVPGVGADQVARQLQPNTGASEQGVVQPVNDGFTYPAIGSVLRVTITPTQEVDL
jgi:hypothetical protein